MFESIKLWLKSKRKLKQYPIKFKIKIIGVISKMPAQ